MNERAPELESAHTARAVLWEVAGPFMDSRPGYLVEFF